MNRKRKEGMLPVGLLLVLFVSSCALVPPKPEFCILEDESDLAYCIPTDPEKEENEKSVAYMKREGYICESPEDFADIKRFIRKVLEELSDKGL